MPLLVDGHNLIGQVPGLSLADADDEAQLVLLLRRYSTAKRGRRVVVVFDHGVYGHPQQLDGYGIRCYFARSPRDADEELIRRLRALTRPREWTLVTSDRAIARVAQERGVQVIAAHEFARQLLAAPTPSRPPAGEQRERRLSQAEIDDWLAFFGQPPEDDTA